VENSKWRKFPDIFQPDILSTRAKSIPLTSQPSAQASALAAPLCGQLFGLPLSCKVRTNKVIDRKRCSRNGNLVLNMKERDKITKSEE
jgi:hypothetical protein